MGAERRSARPTGRRTVQLTRREYLQSCDRRYLARVLKASGNNVTLAAKAAGCNRTEFYKLISRYGLRSGQKFKHRWYPSVSTGMRTFCLSPRPASERMRMSTPC